MSRHYLISGGSSGIGAALATALGADGNQVWICGRDKGRLQAVADSAPGIRWMRCDVAQPSAVAQLIEWVGEQTERLDGLANAAGLFGAIGKVHETDAELWLQTVQVMLGGSYLLSRAAMPLLMRGDSPRILNFAGGGAFDPFPHYSAYACAKASIVRLTETMAVELAETAIRVNAVAPGFVTTAIHQATLDQAPQAPAEHLARTRSLLAEGGGVPIEVAVGCARYLLSPISGELTGKTVSASFDPWDQPGFAELASEINQSELYTMKRINPPNLPDTPMRQRLAELYLSKHGKPVLH